MQQLRRVKGRGLGSGVSPENNAIATKSHGSYYPGRADGGLGASPREQRASNDIAAAILRQPVCGINCGLHPASAWRSSFGSLVSRRERVMGMWCSP